MSKVVKVAFAIPTEGHTPPEALDSLMMLAMRLGKLETESKVLKKDTQFEFYMFSAGRLFTPMAREKLSEAALNHGCDYIFACDDDMIIPQDAFEKLYKHNKDIVAALAFTRNPPHDPVMYQITEGYEDGREYFVNYPVIKYPEDTLVQCDAVGFGCVLFKTSVLKKMAKPYFMSTSPTGEDILFCLNATKTGAKVYMDTSVKTAHISTPLIVTEETYKQHHQGDNHREYRKKEGYETREHCHTDAE